MAVGRSSHSKWLCSCSLSLPVRLAPTSPTPYSRTNLPTLLPHGPTNYSLPTADEESAPQVVSAISRFCATVDLGAYAHGFLCACWVVGIRVHVWVPECVHGCVSTYVLACMCACVGACVAAWLRCVVRGCVLGRLRA